MPFSTATISNGGSEWKRVEEEKQARQRAVEEQLRVCRSVMPSLPKRSEGFAIREIQKRSSAKSTVATCWTGEPTIVHWEIREPMKEADIEIVRHRAWEKFRGLRRESFPTMGVIYRQGLGGVRSHLRNDGSEDLAVLPTVEREDRTLPSIGESRMQPASAAGGQDARRIVIVATLAEATPHGAEQPQPNDSRAGPNVGPSQSHNDRDHLSVLPH